jgi:hypothetical protein
MKNYLKGLVHLEVEVVKQTCLQHHGQCDEAHLFSCKVVYAAAEQDPEAEGVLCDPRHCQSQNVWLINDASEM